MVVMLYIYRMLYKEKLTSKRQQQEVERIAYYDHLTGQPTLKKFKREIDVIVSEYQQQTFGIIHFDIIQFKMLNEIYGFDVGDSVLRSIAKLGDMIHEVNKNFRMERISGDGFLIFDT